MRYDFLRKLSFGAAAFALVALPVAGVPKALAVTDTSDRCTPVIKEQKVKETSVTLKLTCSTLKKTKATVKIEVENNDDSDSTSTQTVTATLSKTGTASIKVSGLDAATSYSVKAKVKKSSKGTYGSYSSAIDTETKGSDYEPTIDAIKSITESSAKLAIICDDLESDSVNVQVAYKKKTSWSKKDYALTLDGDGEGSVTIDGLKSDTAYSFKIRIKKATESTYSAYSSIKTATTDED